MSGSGARILLVGTCVLDLVFDLDDFPLEDSEQRASALRPTSGGNATNTARVLASLGHAVDLAAVVGTDPAGDWLIAELDRAGVGTRGITRQPGATTGISSILRCRRGASRTIVHYRDLPEREPAALSALDLAGYAWLHLEARDSQWQGAMIERVRQLNPACRVSLEAEKHRPGLDALLGRGEVLMLSPEWGRARGHTEIDPALDAAAALAPERLVTCTRGAAGAAAVLPGGNRIQVGGRAPERVVDTLGAGDTFNAGLIHALLSGRAPDLALADANALAGWKCGVAGLDLSGYPG